MARSRKKSGKAVSAHMAVSSKRANAAKPSKSGLSSAVSSKRANAAKPSKSGMIRARVNPKLKNQAEGILAQIGLNVSDAVRLFYQQVILRKGLPFEVRIPNAETRKALQDADAGKDLRRYESVEAMAEDLLP